MPSMDIFADNLSHGVCRHCDATVVWAETTSGRKHPLDGRIADLAPVKTLSKSETPSGRPVYTLDTTINTSHFSTCAGAQQTRRQW